MRTKNSSVTGVTGVIGMAAAASFALLDGRTFGADCSRTSTGRIPITELGQGLYLGQYQGGLYQGGFNAPPIDHAIRAEAAAHDIAPLNAAGLPSPTGRYVLLSIGMSNTTQEFCGGNPCPPGTFSNQAAASPLVNHTTLAIIDGAAGGQSAATWDSPTDPNYDRVRDTRLAPAGLTEAQVRVVWLKVANPQPTRSLPDPQADAFTLVQQMGNIVRSAKTRYPNLEMVFISSRIYAGYADTTLNPEPYAYESAFAVKDVIQAQINQVATGQIDPRAGSLDHRTGAPVLVWGPYLWADGLTPRADGLVWECGNLQADGTHPSPSGRQKVGSMLMNHFLTSRFGAPWFRADGGLPCPSDVDDGTSSGMPDGGVTVDDLLYYLAIFEEGPPAADLDNGSMRGIRDGGVTIDDLLYFLLRFEGGC